MGRRGVLAARVLLAVAALLAVAVLLGLCLVALRLSALPGVAAVADRAARVLAAVAGASSSLSSRSAVTAVGPGLLELPHFCVWGGVGGARPVDKWCRLWTAERGVEGSP